MIMQQAGMSLGKGVRSGGEMRVEQSSDLWNTIPGGSRSLTYPERSPDLLAP